MALKPKPQLPLGNGSFLSGITENFAFHASAESFIAGRLLQCKISPENNRSRKAIRAKILNRNVVILSAYNHIKEVIDIDCTSDKEDEVSLYVAAAPYQQLMEQFFPSPNLLLEDGCPHRHMKTAWEHGMQPLFNSGTETNIVEIVSGFLQAIPRDGVLDLYESLKNLAWQLFLSTFLELSPSEPCFHEFVKLQEDLLRGQFSLIPARINTGFWHSPRKIGVDSRKKLQILISERLELHKPSWLSESTLDYRQDGEVVNHLLMATSSLAVKGFASLLLALLLNAFILRHESSGAKCIADWIDSGHPEECEARRKAVWTETLRLSPPIIGVMRRTTADRIVAAANDEEPDVLIPQGWDVWTYFSGGNRDSNVFGEDADLFKPERYLQDENNLPRPIAFGAGAKACLGASFVQMAGLAVLKAFRTTGIYLEGNVVAPGVRGWLGWEIASSSQWAKDVKQLPTQRPSQPVMVRFSKAP